MPRQARRWLIHRPWDGAATLSKRLNVHPLIAQCLFNRGKHDPDAARAFLDPRLAELHPPHLLHGATEAAERLADAVQQRRKIVIYGDYDVDGTTGAAILWHVLRLAGADVDFHIPHRLEEGYGLSADSVRRFADDGVHTLVTVDCGISAVEEARLARQLGLSLIITDHHRIGDLLPDALIVHPHLGTPYPNAHLSGAGVAFKIAWALAQRLSRAERVDGPFREFLVDAVGMVALATIADVMPLEGENRIFVHFGLRGLAATRLVGLRALIESARLTDQKLDSFDIGFKLAPRMNAAGRMGHARLVVELLTRADEAKAREIAQYLEQQNRRRQTVERNIFKQAREMAEAARMNSDACRGIVLASEDWHAGVIGIVASRVVGAFGRPTFIIAVDGDKAQGSGRSIPGFDLHAALTACAAHLDGFGGHAMAGGLRIRPDRIPAFADAFRHFANNTLTGDDLRPRLTLDAEIALGDLRAPLVQVLHGLGPFGVGNPAPRFCTGPLRLVGEPRVVGRTEDHLQFSVADNGTTLKAIAFGQADRADELIEHGECRLAYEPIINDYNGRRSVELQVTDIRFPHEEPPDYI